MMTPSSDGVKSPPFETAELRKGLTGFLDREFQGRKVGNFKFGAYAFFDFDGEPIYCGQTNELLRTRIRRHLTNQRTDAVAMSVLDPFEVCDIEVWPLPQFEGARKSGPSDHGTTWDAAAAFLNRLEFTIFEKLVAESEFKAILNEKDPPRAEKVVLPTSFRGSIVSADVKRIREHPDFRIARRANTLARLAQVISERQVQHGLRRTLLTQAKRLQWLADRRVRKVSPKDDPSDESDA